MHSWCNRTLIRALIICFIAFGSEKLRTRIVNWQSMCSELVFYNSAPPLHLAGVTDSVSQLRHSIWGMHYGTPPTGSRRFLDEWIQTIRTVGFVLQGQSKWSEENFADTIFDVTLMLPPQAGRNLKKSTMFSANYCRIFSVLQRVEWPQQASFTFISRTLRT